MCAGAAAKSRGGAVPVTALAVRLALGDSSTSALLALAHRCRPAGPLMKASSALPGTMASPCTEVLVASEVYAPVGATANRADSLPASSQPSGRTARVVGWSRAPVTSGTR